MVVQTLCRGHATELARRAVRDGARFVVAAGGDGTVAEVADALGNSDAALGVIPLGTANVVAHERGLPFRPAAIAAALCGTGRATLWPGIARLGNANRLFVQMCGVGFDAHVVATLRLALKRRLGKGAYVLQTLGALGAYRFGTMQVRLDGTLYHASSAIVGKGRFYAGPYTLLPGARPDLPGFHVALFAHGSPAAVLLYGALLPLGCLWRAPGVTIVKASTIDLPDTSQMAQADGDPIGHGPLTIRDAASPVRLVVP